MGTRGLYGLRKNGIDKCTYNHYDSYPDWLGREVLKFCATNNFNRLSTFFNNIEMVREDDVPTTLHIAICKQNGYANFNVSSQSETDWYCLLRNLQGNFKEYTECINRYYTVFMIDDIDFIKDSLFCEYAYIINLDNKSLEFYVGFQKTPQTDNRYGVYPDDRGYYPCKLALVIPLADIGFNNIDEWVAKMDSVSNDDEE